MHSCETTPTEIHTHTGADAPTADTIQRNPGKTPIVSTEAPKNGNCVNGSEWIGVVDKIDHAGGRLSVVDGRLRVMAPAGTLTDQDREVLAEHRGGLIEALTPRSRSTGPDRDQDQVEDEDHRIDESMLVDPVACERCGSLECWLDLRDQRHCLRCDPPIVAQRLRQHADRIRRRERTRTGSNGS
jgi:hypothetical protein